MEGQLQEAKKPASAVAELQARTAELKQVQKTDVPMGTAGSRTAAPLPSDRGNGMMHAGMEKVAEGE